MLRSRILGTLALFSLLVGTAANADDRRHYRDGYRDYARPVYRSEPQVRLGVDVIWGGHGYAAPRPHVVHYPSHYRPYRSYHPGYGGPGYGRPRYGYGEWHGKDRGHRRHHHRKHRGDDRDD